MNFQMKRVSVDAARGYTFACSVLSLFKRCFNIVVIVSLNRVQSSKAFRQIHSRHQPTANSLIFENDSNQLRVDEPFVFIG